MAEEFSEGEKRGLAIAGTIVAGIVFFVILIYNSIILVTDAWQLATLVVYILLFLIVYPVVGKLWYWVILVLCMVIDYAWEYDDEEWVKGLRNIGAPLMSVWPVTGPVGFLITFLGAVFGLLFRRLW